MTAAHDQGVRAARLGAMTAAGLVVLGLPFELVAGRNLPGIPDWPVFLTMGVSAAAFIALAVFRGQRTRWFPSVVLVVNSAALAFALYVRDPYWALVGNWMPFSVNKLACVAVALLATEVWAALIAIAFHATSVALVLVAVGPEVRATIPQEPTGIMAFALISVALVFYRRRQLRLELRFATTRAELLGTERLARTILAIRDLANTPIQTIELCCELLRIRSTLEADVVARMQRALARLCDLSELLRKYEGAVPWRKEDGSIDSIEQLQQSVPQPQVLTSSDEQRRAGSFRAARRVRALRIRRAGSRLG